MQTKHQLCSSNNSMLIKINISRLLNFVNIGIIESRIFSAKLQCHVLQIVVLSTVHFSIAKSVIFHCGILIHCRNNDVNVEHHVHSFSYLTKLRLIHYIKTIIRYNLDKDAHALPLILIIYCDKFI